MDWSRRPEADTPRMEQREFTDARGRRWVGSVTSGTAPGGEERAEVIFVPRDEPSAQKRIGTLDAPPARADERWRQMSEAEIRAVFERSEAA